LFCHSGEACPHASGEPESPYWLRPSVVLYEEMPAFAGMTGQIKKGGSQNFGSRGDRDALSDIQQRKPPQRFGARLIFVDRMSFVGLEVRYVGR
ncbi:hypothetical protein KAX22_01300, partial [bacterium]|nr:hypothetical protein [bacterium]